MSPQNNDQQDDRDATNYGPLPGSADDVADHSPDASAIPVSREDVAVTRYRAPPGGESTTDPAASPRMRQPQVHRVRCPHCHSPIQLVDERPQDVLCPGCGSSFRMREAEGTIAAPSMRLGKFQLLERIGHGAFGAVWRALDVELERIVALKIPHAGLAISAAELQHFQDEARKAAKLRHPGIITIHEVTMLQGMPVIVSDFIQGVTLKDLLEVRRPDFRETARLIADAAEALHHAHVNGLVHRDVKPANIMVERVGLQADGAEGLGRPLVLDFGLALREEALVTMTIDGEVIGTPAYINPEQAAGRGHYADGRSDVFSLGVVLYEMLCGELPFRGSRLMLFDQVLHDDPRAPRRINERIPRDLETICLKAMAKLPAQRYQTAEEFAADLRRFLADEPIHARRAGRAERLWRWCRRRPRDAALIAVVAGLLLLLAVGSTTAAFWIERERRRAEMHLGQTLESLDLLSAAAEQVTDDAPQMEDEQRALLEKALKLRQTILEEEPAAVSRADLARAYHQMGRILKNLGDTNLAKEDFTRAITEWEALAAGADPDARHNAALNHNDLAEVLRATHPTEASEHYQEAVRIQENLAARYPDRDDYRQELARTHNNYGIFLKQNGDASRTAAKKEYDESVDILRALRTKDPSRPDFRADLARALINRGECQGNTPEAIKDYEEAIDLLKALQASNPGKHDFRFRFGVANEDLGMALAGQAKLPEAERAHRVALEAFKRLADEFPKTPLYQKELANTLNNLGLTLWSGPQPNQARDPWEKAQEIFGRLITAHPDMLEYKSNAAQNLSNLGMFALVMDHDPQAAEPLLANAIAQQEAVWKSSGHKNLSSLSRLCGSHYVHAHSLVARGAYSEAAAEAKTLCDLANGENAAERKTDLCNAAGILSLCAPLAAADVEVDKETGQALGREYIAQALQLLRKARADGLAREKYDQDHDFDQVNNRPEFVKFLAEW